MDPRRLLFTEDNSRWRGANKCGPCFRIPLYPPTTSTPEIAQCPTPTHLPQDEWEWTVSDEDSPFTIWQKEIDWQICFSVKLMENHCPCLMVCITPRPPPHHHHQQFSHNGVNKSNGNDNKWIVVVLQWQLLPVRVDSEADHVQQCTSTNRKRREELIVCGGNGFESSSCTF